MVAIFGSLIAVTLLALSAGSTFFMANAVVAHCADVTGACQAAPDLFGEGLVYVVTTVGGLVSALVIAQLSVTEPGKAPTIGTFTPTSRGGAFATNTVITLYLLGWIATGLVALVVGVMIYPKVNATLANIGTTWLGLAVSAAYAYFGINPGTGGRPTAAGPSLASGGSVEILLKDMNSKNSAGLQLLPNNMKWSKAEPGGASDIFKTKSGSYAVLSPNVVVLQGANDVRVGVLENLVPGLAKKGDKGSGKSDECGVVLTWEVL